MRGEAEPSAVHFDPVTSCVSYKCALQLFQRKETRCKLGHAESTQQSRDPHTECAVGPPSNPRRVVI